MNATSFHPRGRTIVLRRLATKDEILAIAAGLEGMKPDIETQSYCGLDEDHMIFVNARQES